MKKLTMVFLSVLFTFLSCKEDGDAVAVKTELKVTPKEVTVGAEKTEKSLNVKTNSDYTVTPKVQWIKILKSDNKEIIRFEVAENSTKSDRTGNIEVLSKDKTVKEVVTVVQAMGKSFVMPFFG